MVQLAEDVILAQRLLNVAKARFDVCCAEVEEIATVLGDSGQRRARLTLGLVCVGKGEEAAEVGVTGQIAGDHHGVRAVDLERRSDDRVATDFPTRLEEPNTPGYASPVG